MIGTRHADSSQLEVRLHAPTPEVVVLRVDGDLDAATSGMFASRARQQLRRAMHLVIDLTDVPFLGIRGLDALHGLHEQAITVGTQVHLAAAHHAVRHPLEVSGLDRVLAVETSAEMIIALLVAPDGARHNGLSSRFSPLTVVTGTSADSP